MLNHDTDPNTIILVTLAAYERAYTSADRRVLKAALDEANRKEIPADYDPADALPSVMALQTLAADTGAPCTTVDPDTMYPHELHALGNARAKQVCYGKTTDQECPLRRQCRATAINELHGVWGGSSELERAAARRLRARQATRGQATADSEDVAV